MIIRPPALGPVKQTLICADAQIIDAGKSSVHEAVVSKLPVFVTVRARPVTVMIATLVRKADGNAIFAESP